MGRTHTKQKCHPSLQARRHCHLHHSTPSQEVTFRPRGLPWVSKCIWAIPITPTEPKRACVTSLRNMPNVWFRLACHVYISNDSRHGRKKEESRAGIFPHYSDFFASSAWLRRLDAVVGSPPAVFCSMSAAQSAAPTVLVKAKKIPKRGISSSRTAGTPKLFRS